MSGTAPDPHEPTWSPGAPRDGSPRRRGSSGRRWAVTVVVLVVVVLAVVTAVLVAEPWRGEEPDPVVSVSVSSSPPGPPTASPAPSPSSTPPPVPGADAVFDAATATTLLVTGADLENDVPGAEAGVRRGLEPGTATWGLPDGAQIRPESCTTAVTVVQGEPVHHDATSWVNDELAFEQDVVVLLDAAAARAAFRALVTTVDECPRYEQVGPDGDGPRWTAEPALEGQGVFPAIVHDVVKAAAGTDMQQTSGHVLVGNTIVSWTATARTADDRDEARSVLGEPEELAAMVEQRALAAVRGLT